MKPKELPSVNRLRELLRYDPTTGVLFWKVATTRMVVAGGLAGRIHRLGYRQIGIDGKIYLAHRIAWALHYGESPPLDLLVNHINHDRSDNRIYNLELVTHSQNMMFRRGPMKNSRSGVRGVYLDTKSNRWRAHIHANGVDYKLGSFSTREEALQARLRASVELHGRFAGGHIEQQKLSVNP